MLRLVFITSSIPLIVSIVSHSKEKEEDWIKSSVPWGVSVIEILWTEFCRNRLVSFRYIKILLKVGVLMFNV